MFLDLIPTVLGAPCDATIKERMKRGNAETKRWDPPEYEAGVGLAIVIIEKKGDQEWLFELSPCSQTLFNGTVRPKWIHVHSLPSVASNQLFQVTGPKAKASPPQLPNHGPTSPDSKPRLKASLDADPQIYYMTGLNIGIIV